MLGGYEEHISGRMFNVSFGGLVDGYITDFNIFSRNFDKEELARWTTCSSYEKGDIFSWNEESVESMTINNVNEDPKFFVELITVEEADICKKKDDKPYLIELFKVGDISNFEAETICKSLNSEFLLLPQTDYELQLLRERYFEYQKQTNVTIIGGCGPWLGGVIKRDNDTLEKDFYPSSGYTFYDRKTGKDLVLEQGVKDALWLDPHSYSNLPEICPTGQNYSSYLFTTQKCTRKTCFSTACKFESPPVLKLSGLCSNAPLDLSFDLSIPTPDPDGEQQRRKFTGPTGWQITYSIEKESWTIVNPRHQNKNLTLISTAEVHIPTGKHSWRIANNTCNNGVTNVQKLLISACKPNQFTCDDGFCISILERCDNFQDCADVSDEKNCMLVYKDEEKYLKDKTPPVKNKKEKLPVELSIDIKEIISINEVEQIINIQFKLEMTWFDSRLQYYNLKENQKMNTLTFPELEGIWVPQILFSNTQHQLISKKDEKSFALVVKNGTGTMSSHEINENIEIYEGSENLLKFVRVYAIDFRCDFDMRWYPFDIQTCTMDLELNGILTDFVDIFPGVFRYLGDEELTQYIIKDSRMLRYNVDEIFGVKVSVTLGRLLLGTILTTYIPTIILVIISHNASFFKPFFFESAISVNVTTMLVLVTLFLSVSGSLPTTSYIKMVDVWFIFNLMVPFGEVLLHTYIDSLRQKDDEEREINHHGKKITVGEKSASAIQVQPYDPNLVSRDEETQDDALKKYYKETKANEVKLARALRIAHVWIPLIVITFTAIYWVLGLSHAGLL